ncbi:plasmodesmata-located protein 6-like [Bidens hawaiensis]|uniref:plasmodesmata-located protein 6-like n=1 Tax=Bidens hawaiensis TaxID=980011 RepID=UPI00404B46D4
MKQACFLAFLVFSLIIPFLSVAKESIVYFECSQLYLISKAYESNVNSLFTSLISSASVSNFNKFEISPQSDVVYGLFQCRGDLSSHDCKNCVENSVSQLKKTCPKSTSGTIQLEGCFIKYDNTSSFGVEDKVKVFKRCGPSVGYNSDTLARIDDALAYLVSGTGPYFRVGVLGRVQGMMQCVQDLSVSDCEDCVLEARGRVRSECGTSTWGDMYLGKCYIRYADGGFHPIKGIDVVNINDDLRGGTRKSKNIQRVAGIVVGVLLGVGALGFTLTISITKVYRIRVKKEVTIVRNKVEEAEREARSAREQARAAREEVEVARRESESQKLQIDTLSKQRDWYKTMSSTGRV